MKNWGMWCTADTLGDDAQVIFDQNGLFVLVVKRKNRENLEYLGTER
jgi:hypothetical protein